MAIVGIHLGGTYQAVALARDDGQLVHEEVLPPGSPVESLERVGAAIRRLDPGLEPLFGISSAGPLDVHRGMILSPPNMPGWDQVPICDWCERGFGGRAFLMHDVSARVLAESRYGVGRGVRNLIYVPTGAGISVGIMCDGRLVEGSSGNAGELGHLRLTEDGPIGHGKAGSVEGWCSTSGLPRRIAELRASGSMPAGWACTTAEDLGPAADAGDSLARDLLAETGRHLGRTLAMLIDLFNPELIVLGSQFATRRAWMEPAMQAEIRREALPALLAGCRIEVSQLSGQTGGRQGVAVAIHQVAGFRHAVDRSMETALATLRGSD